MNWTIKLNPLKGYLGFLSQPDRMRIRKKMQYNCFYIITFIGQRNGIVNHISIQRALDSAVSFLYLYVPLVAVNGVLMTRQCSGIVKTSDDTKLLCSGSA